MSDDETKTSWPAWYFGPGDQSQIFQEADEIPEGWEDHPNKVGKESRGKKQPEQNGGAQDDPYKDFTDAQVIEQLKIRGIEFSEKWPSHKLLAALKEAK